MIAPAIIDHPPSVSRRSDFIDPSTCRWHPERGVYGKGRDSVSGVKGMMNKSVRVVRKKAEDRRVTRTRHALGTALVELMVARRFDDISVQQVLDRAQVGRATFYAHFRNKHDLLLSDAERFFGSLAQRFMENAGTSMRVAPVAELFSHVSEYHHFQRALEQSELRDPVYELLIGHLAR